MEWAVQVIELSGFQLGMEDTPRVGPDGLVLTVRERAGAPHPSDPLQVPLGQSFLVASSWAS